ncbi:MAG TPA: lasso peptide biosynthesis protein, partial [Ktedonobacteraceae bacterium]
CVTKNISDAFIIALVNKEYWFYRLITGLIERRTARVIGQMPGNEGLCLIRSLALCAYLLSLDVPATIIIARPKYGSRSGFKLHVWVEIHGKPLNEPPNIGDGYRQLYAFPETVQTWPKEDGEVSNARH